MGSLRLTPKIVEQEIGIKPSDSWNVGEIGKYGGVRKYSCWQYNSEGIGDDVMPIVKNVIDILSSKKAQLNTLINNYKDCSIALDIIINCGTELPLLALDGYVVSFLGSVNSSIDFDIYMNN